MNDEQEPYDSIGAVVIGRNEGAKLKCCLESTTAKIEHTIYVDSGSSDNSIAVSKSFGVEVVELDMSIPFTAARARNAGFSRLTEMVPGIRFVQFIDGDCEIDSGWITVAYKFLDQHKGAAVVCGRRRERFPDRSVYNMLCDFEWNSLKGNVKSCGGDAMMRARALKQVGGFRDDLIAGEEPELCVRLREAKWEIWRLENEMTLHDADMTSFYQWWKRAMRSGYAFAQGMYLHGGPPEYQNVRESIRIWFWSVVVPLLTVWTVMYINSAGLTLLILYPLQMVRITQNNGGLSRKNCVNAFYLLLGKFPEMLGQLKFYFNRIMRVQARLIEYK